MHNPPLFALLATYWSFSECCCPPLLKNCWVLDPGSKIRRCGRCPVRRASHSLVSPTPSSDHLGMHHLPQRHRWNNNNPEWLMFSLPVPPLFVSRFPPLHLFPSRPRGFISLTSSLSINRTVPTLPFWSISLREWYPSEPAEHTSEWCLAVGVLEDVRHQQHG